MNPHHETVAEARNLAPVLAAATPEAKRAAELLLELSQRLEDAWRMHRERSMLGL